MKALVLAVVSALIVLSQLARASESEPLYGFAAANSTAERDWENKIKSIPSPSKMKDMITRPSKSTASPSASRLTATVTERD